MKQNDNCMTNRVYQVSTLDVVVLTLLMLVALFLRRHHYLSFNFCWKNAKFQAEVGGLLRG